MDYSTYFTATPQALQYFAFPPTPIFSEDSKLDGADPIDAALFPPYDFRFSQPQQQQQQQPQTQSDIQRSIAPLSATTPAIPAHPNGAETSPTHLSAPSFGSPTGLDTGLGLDLQTTGQSAEDSLGPARSASEENDNLTPAQSRRKAQNRAAQRAFRERKERHVKDLEAKLSALESSASSLATDNERLKLALQRATTENEILRATSSSAHRSSISSSADESDAGRPPDGGANVPALGSGIGSDFGAGSAATAAQAQLARKDIQAWHGAMGDSLPGTDSYTMAILAAANGLQAAGVSNAAQPNMLLRSHSTSSAPPTIPLAPRATPSFLPAAAAWDLIQAHPLVRRGIVDIADVCEALRGQARCDGPGPMFREDAVWRAVEQARRSGGDELI